LSTRPPGMVVVRILKINNGITKLDKHEVMED
jgi:hypothetical protein